MAYLSIQLFCKFHKLNKQQTGGVIIAGAVNALPSKQTYPYIDLKLLRLPEPLGPLTWSWLSVLAGAPQGAEA